MNNHQHALEESREKVNLLKERTGLIGLEGLTRAYVAYICSVQDLELEILARAYIACMSGGSQSRQPQKDFIMSVEPEVIDNIHKDYKLVQERLPAFCSCIKQIVDKMYQDLTNRLVPIK